MQGQGLGILFILGLGVFGGMMGAWIFQRLRIPQVVGYICIGLIIGQSGFGVVSAEDAQALRPFNLFALGIIGFLVGGEILFSTLRKYARSFTAILIGEGLAACLLVGVGSFGILYFTLGTWTYALAASVVLAAIASATDPASTIDVLWEYRAKGMLTTTIVAIVALDDALAMLLYGLGVSAAQLLIQGEGHIGQHLLHVGIHLAGAVLLGVGGAYLLNLFLRWMHRPERSLSLAVGYLLLVISIASFTGLDIILATMSLGMVLANIAPRRSKPLFEMLRSFSTPIYVLFFVLVGARLNVSSMPWWLWGVVLVYVAGRSVGKIYGARYGAQVTGSDPVVQKYIGAGLFAQGGVAVGLSIVASHHLNHINLSVGMSLGDLVVFVVTATTLVVQLIGPPVVKYIAKASGEAGRNVTEEDVIAEWKVRDAMLQPVELIEDTEPVRRVVERFTHSDQLIYPVVDEQRQVVGTISTEELKNVLGTQDAWDWLLAADMMSETQETAIASTPLQEILDHMQDLEIDEIPVVESAAHPVPVGILERRTIRRRVAAGLLARQQGRSG